jgi:hypothetical protein
MQEAIEKLKAEMDKEKNSYVQVVGEYLVSHLEKNPRDAEKILAADKTIIKSLEDMKKEASKKKVGNMAILTPNEGFAVVLKYFGIEAKPLACDVPIVTPAAVASQPSNTDFDVKLDDFL